MDKFPENYESYLAIDSTHFHSKLSEVEFYKDGYITIIELLESKMQVSLV